MKRIKPTSTNNINRQTLSGACEEVFAIDLIAGRWKMMIFCILKENSMRFSELRDSIPNVSERMLALHLRELERDLLVKRTVYPEVPTRVEYALTESGKALLPLWAQLKEWGARHKEIMLAETV